MGRYLDIADEWERTRNKGRPKVLDGHLVERVIWKTEQAAIFRDERGSYWRYLYAHAQAWPVLMGGR